MDADTAPVVLQGDMAAASPAAMLWSHHVVEVIERIKSSMRTQERKGLHHSAADLALD